MAIKGVKIPDENFKGGGGGGDEGLIQNLAAEEAGSPYNADAKVILDDFNEARGTLSNTEITNSRLQLQSGETDGSYERNREVSPNVSSVSGITRLCPTTAAPENVAVFSNTFTFKGDVSNLFEVGKPVIIMKQITTDDAPAYVALMDGENKVAKLVVAPSGINYSSGPNTTTVQLLNPESLVLDFGISSSTYRDVLRIVPFSVDFMVSGEETPGPGDYESMDIQDLSMWSPQVLANPGEVDQAFVPVSLGGPVIRQAADMSDNGTYGLVSVLVWNGTVPVWKFYYTNNGGTSWNLLAFTDSFASSWSYASAEGSLHGYVNAFVQVANNGKAFVAYSSYVNVTTSYHVKGAYVDLSAGTPTMLGSAATGVDAQNSDGSAGFIFINTTNNRVCSGLAADRTDLSFIAVAGEVQNDTGNYVRFYTNGGATHQNSHLAGNGVKYGRRTPVIVSGSGSSHRTYIIRGDSIDSEIQYSIYDQPSATPSTGTVTTEDSFPLDARESGGKGYILFKRISDGMACYRSFNISGTPTFSSTKTLIAQIGIDDLHGLDIYENNSGQWFNALKPYTSMIAINPSDNNQAFFSLDVGHPDSRFRPVVVEVRDDTTFAGALITNLGATGDQALRRNTGTPPDSIDLAQTVTLSGQNVRTFSVKVYRGGVIPTGHNVTCEIQATTAGVPNGTVVATALNSYAASDLTSNSSYQWAHFRFNTQVLTGVYAFVFKSTFPITASNAAVVFQQGNAYGGGQCYRSITGGSWVDVGGDLVFEVHGEWLYNMDQLRAEKQRTVGVLQTNCAESSIVYGNNGPIYLGRIMFSTYYHDRKRTTGIPFKTQFSAGTGSTSASTFLTPDILGYESADKYLVFSTECGADSSARINVNTNTVSTTEKAEDRSGLDAIVNAYTDVTFGNQALFTSGKSAVFNTTSSQIRYAASAGATDSTADAWALLKDGSPFAIEVEFMLTTLPSVKGFHSMLVSKYTNAVAEQGWVFGVNTNNRLFFDKNLGTLTVTEGSTVLTTGVRYVAKVTGDGTNIRLYLNEVEESYLSQNTTAYNIGSTTADLAIGGLFNTGVYALGGQLGYVKMIKGSSTFAKDGFSYQPGLSPVLNLKHGMTVQSHIGQNSDDTLDYDQSLFQSYSAGAAVVDSYDMLIKHSHDLPISDKFLGAKIEMHRASDRNKMSVGGFAWRYSK